MLNTYPIQNTYSVNYCMFPSPNRLMKRSEDLNKRIGTLIIKYDPNKSVMIGKWTRNQSAFRHVYYYPCC